MPQIYATILTLSQFFKHFVLLSELETFFKKIVRDQHKNVSFYFENKSTHNRWLSNRPNKYFAGLYLVGQLTPDFCANQRIKDDRMENSINEADIGTICISSTPT